MRMVNDTAVIERSGVSNEQEFGMKFNAKMARILSKQIYSNVIQAPIREIICNAWDSHRAADKLDVKVRVHLPNQMEPWFEVQDWGVGLSPEAMGEVYTQYGGTTKGDNNQDIGGLGLGCKAPFAYTDAFTVTSVHEGMQRHYSMFKNEKGIPTMVLMGSVPTKECNGVTVRVPVRGTDFKRFLRETQWVLKWFPDQFIVSGNPEYTRLTPKVLADMQGADWHLQENGYYDRNPALAVMGHVAYPLQMDQLPERFKGVLGNQNISLVCEFPIGELDISPTREELSYDDVTVAVITRKLDLILQECRQMLESRIRNSTSLWQARCVVHAWRSNQYMHSVLNVLVANGMQLTWQGMELGDSSIYMHEAPAVNKDTPHAHVMQINVTTRGRTVNYVSTLADTVFVEADCADASSRAKKAYYGKNGHVYLISGMDSQRKAMIEHLGMPTTIKASTLPPVERKKMPFKGHAWMGHSWNRRTKSDYWDKEQQLTMDQGGFYVTQVHWMAVNEHDQAIRMSQMMDVARHLGLIDSTTKVWGINKTNTKLVASEKKWIRFDTWFQVQVKHLLADANTHTEILSQRMISQVQQIVDISSDVFVKLMNKHWIHMHNNVGRFARAYADAVRAQANQDRVHHLRNAANLVGMTISDDTTTDLVTMWRSCEHAYPLLKFIRRHTDDATWEQMTTYVELVDHKHPVAVTAA